MQLVMMPHLYFCCGRTLCVDSSTTESERPECDNAVACADCSSGSNVSGDAKYVRAKPQGTTVHLKEMRRCVAEHVSTESPAAIHHRGSFQDLLQHVAQNVGASAHLHIGLQQKDLQLHNCLKLVTEYLWHASMAPPCLL